MKKAIILLAALTAALTFASCDKNNGNGGNTGSGTGTEVSIEATKTGQWHYFSFAQNKELGVADDTDTSWKERTDWDIAINKYHVRTNSGDSTTAGTGGVYTCEAGVTFASLTAVPAGATFATDETVTESGMGGETTTTKSTATVIQFQLDANGDKVMPPVYLPSPIYIFRSADGTKHYKVNFTQYQGIGTDGETVSGMVKFTYAEL